MTRYEQFTFVTDLIDSVKENMLKDLSAKVPEQWDGIELRSWIACRFERAVIGQMSRSRMRAFNNDLTVLNL